MSFGLDFACRGISDKAETPPPLGNRTLKGYLTTMNFWLNDRAVIAVSGPAAREFLQGLITNDARLIAPDAPLYAALLTPQGKILFDFLIFESDGTLLVDSAAVLRDALVARLSFYRLRATIEIAPRDDLAVAWTQENPLAAAPFIRDPRRPALGYRAIVPRDTGAIMQDQGAYTALRLERGVPEGSDFGQDKMFALDADLDELGGVAFDKGCYVGQEMTARMKHRGTARKRFLAVATTDGSALPAPPTAITANDREVGTISSTYGANGFALVRLDRLEEVGHFPLQASNVAIRVTRPDWLSLLTEEAKA
ncbi:MAG: YgfZ/GcvT domain-containing protein [Rhizomicrobium sp.]